MKPDKLSRVLVAVWLILQGIACTKTNKGSNNGSGGNGDPGSKPDTTPVVHTLTVSTLAGNGYNAKANGGYADGPGATAEFADPVGIAVDSLGNVYVAEYGGHRLRKITPAGIVSTLAGTGYESAVEGTGTQAGFAFPWGAAIDGKGNIYVANIGDARIQKVTPQGAVSVLAGHSSAGFADGSAAAAKFNNPYGVAVDAAGNVYVGDYRNHRIRKITPAAQVITLAGDGKAGYIDGPGVSAEFNSPNGIAVDTHGNVYVADEGNERIRKITPEGVVSTLAGNGTNNLGHGGFADGPAASAEFSSPAALVPDTKGNIYVADAGNNCIREITTAGMVTTIAGNGNASYADGSGAAAEFNLPRGIAIDAKGNLYVSDWGNQRIRKITIQ